MSNYFLPDIWKTPDQMGGAWGGLNQPTAGSRFEQTLPMGEADFQLYSLGTPNGLKATIMFEELIELGVEISYDLYRIKIGEGDQFGSGFVAINPNSKIPAMIDQASQETIRIFESSSILLYLADKYHKLIPDDFSKRTEVLNWLFWQTGAAPFLGGGFGHFFHYAPEKLEYPINRFTMEAKRQLDLLDKELANKRFITGQDYNIADIAIWAWYGRLAQDKLWEGAGRFLDIKGYKNLVRWAEEISERPAVKRGLEVTYKEIN